MSSDDEREERELDLTSPEVVTKYKCASDIVNKALKMFISGINLVELCEKADSFIIYHDKIELYFTVYILSGSNAKTIQCLNVLA